jgi:hypothetical protein
VELLTGAHMSGYMLGTGEGRLTYGTFVVTSHRCRVEWARVVRSSASKTK